MKRRAIIPDDVKHAAIDIDRHSPQVQAAAAFLRGAVPEVVNELGLRGINRLMVEGGAGIARAFLQAGCVDDVYLFQSRTNIGPAGLTGLDDVALQPFSLCQQETLGDDVLSVYEHAN